MSTQHPDNACRPPFSSSGQMSGEDEISEAYLLYSQFGCHEQLWDFEGKKAVPWVVTELMGRDRLFFQQRPLGQETFLTFRIPNPDIERAEAKLIPEILSSIPRCFDATQTVYQSGLPPVFEVVLPMSRSVSQLNRLYYYYRNFIVYQKRLRIFRGDRITIGRWLGEFSPETINVIPLFENRSSLLQADRILAGYMKEKNLEYQRVFLARSDPALNYGSLAAVLLLNIALQRLHLLEGKIGVPVYPILGVGSAPFRGNFKPGKALAMVDGYRSCQTFTLQSSFKYDWPAEAVKEAIQQINSAGRGAPLPVDEGQCLQLLNRTTLAYQAQIPEVASWVNRLSPHLPARRLRKLHAGLFGYARRSGSTHLPRAIPFCGSLYSLGLPPELLGLQNLTDRDLRVIEKNYPGPSFLDDMRDAMAYYNPLTLTLWSREMRTRIEKAAAVVRCDPNPDHLEITSRIIGCLQRNNTGALPALVEEAAQVRRFLG
jgi:phosphoenolpyruvate carboxylase